MGEDMLLPNMVLEPRTEGVFTQGCDGYARDSVILSVNHFLPVVDKVHIVRYGRIWGGITKPIALVPENHVFGEESIFVCYYIVIPN